jgi:LacI family transcriptional regulator
MWSYGNWSSASGEAAFAELITKHPQMNAVFASNDQMALGVLHYCFKNSIRVPQDLAVIGFDDLTESAFFSPTLTTITHPLREMGNLAVKTLLKQIDGHPSSENVITLKTELVVRDSTSLPPNHFTS